MEVPMLRFVILLFFTLNFTPLLTSQAAEHRGPDYIPIRTTRLVSDAEHTQFLKNTLATATHQVMISTYNVSPDRLFGQEGLGQAIIDAAERGVAIYIYYENRPWYSQEDYADLCAVTSYCAKFEENANHSKCVIKDKSTVAIGSHNWLSDTRKGSSNASMVVTGGLALGLINDVWQGIRFYQSLEYGNERGVERFLEDRDAFSTGEYQFSPGEFLYTLRTPEAHGILLDEVLEKAKERVLLFSPFIRLQKLRGTFTDQLLRKLQQRGVVIKLITLPSPCDRVPREQKEIFSSLDDLSTRYRNFSYMKHPNFHAKTLLADNFICEGSFNWLSAVAQIDHEANNFEMSVAVRGRIALDMIQSFEGTALGKAVLEEPRKIGYVPLEKTPQTVPRVTQLSQQSKKFRPQDEPHANEQPPLKRVKTVFLNTPASFEGIVKTFSGKQFGIEGYCVRFNDGDYLRDGRKTILYFETPEKAKQAAYAIWRK